jgi:hypothetical protein
VQKAKYPNLKHSELTDKELIELGKKLQSFYELGYVNKKAALGYSFLKGIVTGFGVFLGGTVAVTILFWLLSGLETIPLVGPIVEAINRSLK